MIITHDHGIVTDHDNMILMMAHEGALRLSQQTVNSILASESSMTHMAEMVDEYLSNLYDPADPDSIMSFESSASLCCLFLSDWTLFRNPDYFHSL